MAVAGCKDNGLAFSLVDIGRVNFRANVLLGNLACLDDRLLAAIALNKGIHHGIANYQGLVSLPGIRRELSSSIYDPMSAMS